MEYNLGYKKYAALAIITLVFIALIVSLAVSNPAHAQVASSTSATTTATTSSAVTPGCSISINPGSIAAGQYAQLIWTSSNAANLSFDQGLGTAYPVNTGSIFIHPMATQAYTGIASNDTASSTCQATLTVTAALPPASTDTTTATSTPLVATSTPPIMPPIAITPAPYPGSDSTPVPMIVTVDKTGTILIRGVVKMVGRDLITLNSWGGAWNIRTASANVTASIHAVGDVSGITVGDFVGVSGRVASDQIWTVDADIVKDWTQTGSGSTGTVSSSAPSSSPSTTLYTGSASDIKADSFTLTNANGKTYTVNVASDTSVWNTARETVDMTDIQDGDSIRINGVVQDDGSIDASVVRDISI